MVLNIQPTLNPIIYKIRDAGNGNIDIHTRINGNNNHGRTERNTLNHMGGGRDNDRGGEEMRGDRF